MQLDAGLNRSFLDLEGPFGSTFSSSARERLLGSNLSSSSKIYIDEIKPIYKKAHEFFKNVKKIYLQAFIYRGLYDFKEDLNHDISNIAPYARKIADGSWWTGKWLTIVGNLSSEDEERDLKEALCQESSVEEMDCTDFIHPEEYRVISAIFAKPMLDGIPSDSITLEQKTTTGSIDKKGWEQFFIGDFTDDFIVENFNKKMIRSIS